MMAPDFLRQQFDIFNTDRQKCDPGFLSFIEEKIRENQKEIAESMDEKEGEETESEPELPLPEQQREAFDGYLKCFEFSPSDFLGKRVLDIGCGEGKFVEYCIENGVTNNAFGIDLSEYAGKLKDNFKSKDFSDTSEFQDIDYAVSRNSAAAFIWETIDPAKTLQNWLDSLGTGGQIRIYPVVDIEATAKADEYSYLSNYGQWLSLLQKFSAEGKIEFELIAKSIAAVGKDNVIILNHLLVIKKK
jgi:SAM-dependent methyltransferase